MYRVDDRDRVVPLKDLPQSSVGAPSPLLLAGEGTVILAYYLQSRVANWDGKSVRVIDPTDSDEPIALVRFKSCAAHMFGRPNDEAFSGHPLAGRGLKPYGTFRVEESSWVRQLERMNSVHPNHDPRADESLQHLVFAFHDSTFECV